MTDLQKEPKVSIVCAWYNRADYIRDTVDSLLNQDFDDYEVIIANDGSPDPRVREILDSYNDPRLKVIHQKNEGFTKTIKMLVEKARAPFVAIQGAGDVSYKDRLSTQYYFMTENEDVGAVGSGFDADLEGGGNLRYSKPKDIKTVEQLKKSVPFTHGTIMYRKSVYVESGGYDVRFKYCSDWDLYFRVLELSKITAIDKPLYKKIEFNDGFSFSPIHKFSQMLHKEAAINRTPEREKIADTVIERSENIKPYKPYYLYKSARLVASFLKRKDYSKAWVWFKYFAINFFQVYKNFTK